MYNQRKGLTVDEALQLFFEQETDESDFSENEIYDDDYYDGGDGDGEIECNNVDPNLDNPQFAEDNESDDNLINYGRTSCVDNSSIVIENFSSSSGPVHCLEP